MKLRALSCLLLLSVVVAGCGARTEPAPETVTLAMGFVPNVQFTPFYVAVDKGYFAEEGIQVKFDYGWETDLLKLVGADELQFAIGSGDQVLLARNQGLPVVYVLNWYRRFPVSVVSLAENGLKVPADLTNHRVGTPAAYGASYIGWRALLDAAGLREADMELVSIGYTQVAALTEGQVDAAICYAMNEPVQLQAAGKALDIIYVADYANLVSNGLITNDVSVARRPELVQGMVRASLRGLAYTLEHPDEAFEIASRYVPEAVSDDSTKAVNRAVLAKSIEFWQAPAGELGLSVQADWELSSRVMQEMGLIGQVELKSVFTNRFVDKAGK